MTKISKRTIRRILSSDRKVRTFYDNKAKQFRSGCCSLGEWEQFVGRIENSLNKHKLGTTDRLWYEHRLSKNI